MKPTCKEFSDQEWSKIRGNFGLISITELHHTSQYVKGCYAHLSLGPEGGRHIDWGNPPSDQENSPKKLKQGLPNRICKTWYRLAFGEQRGSLCSIQQTIREVEARLDTFGIPGSKFTLLYDAEASLSLPDQLKLNNLFRFREVPLRPYTLYPVQAYTPRAC